MAISTLGRFVASAALVGLCAAAHPNTAARGEKHHGRDPLKLFSLPLEPIPALPPSDSADQSCNLKHSGVTPASKVIRLHLTSALFAHLIDGHANEYTPPSTGTTIYPSYLDTTKASRHCITADYCVDDDSGNVLISRLPPPTDPKSYYTRLDIDLAGQWGPDLGGNTYAPILFEVVLDDSNLKFIPSTTSDTSATGVETDDQTAPLKLFDCRQPIGTAPGGARAIKFRVNHMSTSNPTGHLNISVIVTEPACNMSACFVAPLVIDPHVPNTGGGG
jgi:hypothetical protein